MNKKSFYLAAVWIFGLAFAAIASPIFLSAQAQNMDFRHLLEAPSFAHWLGTDSLGRDLFARLLCGTTVSLGVGVIAVAIAVVLGVLVGAFAGYTGGMCDRILMAVVDILLCFPTFFLILAVIAVLGPGIFHVFLIIGLTSWMGTARLVRAEVLTLKEREYVLAARVMGARSGWIIFRHLVPNALGVVIVNAILGLSAAILTEGALSFLGIGVQPPIPSWGNILTDGRATLGVAWWLTLFPGLVIFLTVLSANTLGEALDSHFRGDSHVA